MSNEQHLIENALFYYRQHNDFNFDSCQLVKEQREMCNVSLQALQEFVEYVFYNVLETEDDRARYFNDRKNTTRKN